MLSATLAPPVPPAPKNPGIDPIHPTRNMSTPPDGPILEPKPAPYPGGFTVDWERLLTWPSTTPRDPRPGAPDPGPIPKPNPYPTGPRG